MRGLRGGDHTVATEEELVDLDRKLKQLKLDYERYFLGTRPREPVVMRADVEKTMVRLANNPIQNTALRFKYNSICSRFQAFKRQWNETLRQIENGTYARHRFKANLRGAGGSAGAPPPPDSGGEDLFSSYRDARLACGQAARSLTPKKFEQMLEKQRGQLAAKFGDDARFQFRVVVEDGRAKLKASRQRA